MFDIVIDSGFLPLESPVHGLWVHSAMHAALHHKGGDVVRQVLEVISSDCAAWASHHGKSVVLCGHSLGAAYAQLVSAELLHLHASPEGSGSGHPGSGSSSRNEPMTLHMNNLHIGLRSISFGGPSVFHNPDPDVPAQLQLFQRLNRSCFNFINAYDLVPRLPVRPGLSCYLAIYSLL